MNYIIFEYDGWQYRLCNNGKFVTHSKNDPLEEAEAFKNNDDFRSWFKEKYKDYNLVLMCTYGNVEVLRDTTKLE